MQPPLKYRSVNEAGVNKSSSASRLGKFENLPQDGRPGRDVPGAGGEEAGGRILPQAPQGRST